MVSQALFKDKNSEKLTAQLTLRSEFTCVWFMGSNQLLMPSYSDLVLQPVRILTVKPATLKL